MTENHRKFYNASLKVGFDQDHRDKIEHQISQYNAAVKIGKQQYERLDLAKQRAAKIKRNVLDELEKNLKEFEGNFLKNGGEIIWAENTEEAIDAVVELVNKHSIKRVVKSKSMVSEEVGLNTHLQKMGVDTLESDLGEYIVQLSGEKPYHIVTPAMHKSLADVQRLFNEKFELAEDSSPEQITDFVQKKLRKHFFKADMGITGANFLIANQGAIALTENEGNQVLGTSLPKIHLAITGIEKLIPDITDLDLFWSLLATHGTGQNITSYNTVVKGPARKGESDGPEKMYLILIDNGRTKVLNTQKQREALACIKCGACLNACPVYKTIGGHAYGSTYSGPIGAVLTPLMKGLEAYDHLSHACTSCGKCAEVCPVEIPIDELLLYNRRLAVEENVGNVDMAALIKSYKRAMKSRKLLELPNATFKRLYLNNKLKRNWGPRREMFRPAKKSFHRMWKEDKH